MPVRPTTIPTKEEEEEEQVVPKKKKKGKNKNKKFDHPTGHVVGSSSSSVTPLATIVHAYSLLQHPCPELYRLIEEQQHDDDDEQATTGYAESICAAATSVHDLERIATGLESLGYTVPHFRQAMGQWQDKNAEAAADADAALQPQQDQPQPVQEISNGQ
jgi:hypothetical protein